jgi:hypothetical protein
MEDLIKSRQVLYELEAYIATQGEDPVIKEIIKEVFGK